MSAIKDFAEQAAARAAAVEAENSPGYKFDPATIMIIIEMIMKFIQMFQDCKKNSEQAVESARSPNMIERLVFKLRSNRMLRKAGYSKSARRSIRQGVLDTARGVSVRQIDEMYEEV